MKWKVVSVLALLSVVILAIVLAFSRRSQAQSTTRAARTYAYKVELVGYNERKDLERRLTDDGRNGWHIVRVEVFGVDHNELVVVLEKPDAAP